MPGRNASASEVFDPAIGWDLPEGGGDRPGSRSSIEAEETGAAAGSGASGAHPDLRIVDAFSGVEEHDYSLHLHSSSAPGVGRNDGPVTAFSTPPPSKDVRYPSSGDVIAGFRVVRELGRGAFARVYLAEQLALSRRQVVLKAATHSIGEESQVLAQLQHSHIVPILSLHEDPARGLHLFCMPYLGGANLAQLLAAAGAEAALDASVTGESLIKALDQVGSPLRVPVVDRPQNDPDDPASSSVLNLGASPSSIDSREGRGGGQPSRVRSALGRYWTMLADWDTEAGSTRGRAPSVDRAQPARRFLRHASFVQAATWIAARLAEGLEHAHCRGLLHRDLKPSNILITADGTPMILDFNLAAAADPAVESHDRLGGTLPYMAPEHLEAFGPASSARVDRRSDLYAMGLILFEMAAGRHPFEPPPEGLSTIAMLDHMIADRRAGAPSARSINREIPWGLDSVLRKCLAPDPDRRYQTAGELAEDLVRLLEDRPLRYAQETSAREYAAKFLRRHPKFSSSSSVAAVSIILLIGLGMILGTVRGRWEAASARVGIEQFDGDFARCQLLLNTTIGSAEGSDGHNLIEGLELARETLSRYGLDGGGGRWEDGPLVAPLPPAERFGLAERLAELMMLEARAEVVLARGRTEAEHAEALRRAVDRLRIAERVDPRPPATLFEERAGYAAALGMAEEAARDRAHAAEIPPVSARDYYLRGSAALASRRPDRAEVLLDRAVGLDPERFWSWFALGVCHFDQGRYDVAAADFAACTLLEPGSAWSHANRGLAMALDGRVAEARRAYDRALDLDPELVPARINRALANLELGEPHRAAADLTLVVERPGYHDAGPAGDLGGGPRPIRSDRRGGTGLRPGTPGPAERRRGAGRPGVRQARSVPRRRPIGPDPGPRARPEGSACPPRLRSPAPLRGPGGGTWASGCGAGRHAGTPRRDRAPGHDPGPPREAIGPERRRPAPRLADSATPLQRRVRLEHPLRGPRGQRPRGGRIRAAPAGNRRRRGRFPDRRRPRPRPDPLPVGIRRVSQRDDEKSGPDPELVKMPMTLVDKAIRSNLRRMSDGRFSNIVPAMPRPGGSSRMR